MRKIKAQSEMVGFTMIVIIIIILGVIFLGMALRKDKSYTVLDDAEVGNFLIAIEDFTSSCVFDREPNYRSIRDLSVDCYKGSSCKDGRSACEILNSTYYEVSRFFGPGGTVGYYQIKTYHRNICNDTSTKNPDLTYTFQGDSKKCPRKISSEATIPVTGEEFGCVVTELEICRVE